MKQPSSSSKCFVMALHRTEPPHIKVKSTKLTNITAPPFSTSAWTCQLHNPAVLPLEKQHLLPILLYSGWDPGLVQTIRKREKSISYSHCKLNPQFLDLLAAPTVVSWPSITKSIQFNHTVTCFLHNATSN
jgi:hypothetical protein